MSIPRFEGVQLSSLSQPGKVSVRFAVYWDSRREGDFSPMIVAALLSPPDETNKFPLSIFKLCFLVYEQS